MIDEASVGDAQRREARRWRAYRKVETAGIEPASAVALQWLLRAYPAL